MLSSVKKSCRLVSEEQTTEEGAHSLCTLEYYSFFFLFSFVGVFFFFFTLYFITPVTNNQIIHCIQQLTVFRLIGYFCNQLNFRKTSENTQQCFRLIYNYLKAVVLSNNSLKPIGNQLTVLYTETEKGRKSLLLRNWNV